MNRLVLGVLAHVDAGKTTLSEAMLYRAGEIRRLGRVDHGDTFLDTDAQEKARGITIFSAVARLRLRNTELTLLDTPGHVDFGAETERALQVLDAAVLVVSAVDGVQSHTETLWRLLARYRVPVFVFINKMDLAGADAPRVLAELRRRLGEGFVPLVPLPSQDGGAALSVAGQSAGNAPAGKDGGGEKGPAGQGDPFPPALPARLAQPVLEELALCDEALLDLVLDEDAAPARLDAAIARAVAARRVFPCLAGSALKGEGLDLLFDALERFAPAPVWGTAFGARVYKISQDTQGARLTHLKITGGSLKTRDMVSGLGPDGPWQEKAAGLRVYAGARSQSIEEAPAGTVCAVLGLSQTRPGQGLGAEADAPAPLLEPVLRYRVLSDDGADPHTLLGALRRVEMQEPQLHVAFDADSGALFVQLMGEVQLEVLRRLLADRGLAVHFDDGGILYRETLTQAVEGVGHYEPLRHYAEVHLLLEPGPRGSGLQLASACPTDTLEKNWQNLILTHLGEKTHRGVLTGAPITDIKITLLAGRAHPKHTEGGDFRQATYRALRQGLRSVPCQLLEPWYTFRLELPAENVGRAMTDLQQRAAECDPPLTQGETVLLCGSAPVAALQGYAAVLRSYTHGRGVLSCTPDGFRPCHNAEDVIAAAAYDPDADVENSADSIFCAHGAGFLVKWDQVRRYMHLDTGWGRAGFGGGAAEGTEGADAGRAASNAAKSASGAARYGGSVTHYRGSLEEDKELLAIYERTYGPIRRRGPELFASTHAQLQREAAQTPLLPECLLVDGYNILFAWDDLHALAAEDLNAARQRLMDILCNYRGWHGGELILVFDAYRVKGNPGSVEEYHGIHVVYTKEAETADMYIEKTTHQLGGGYRVRVATSDALEQLIILGHGALRLSAEGFRQEVEAAEKAIREHLEG